MPAMVCLTEHRRHAQVLAAEPLSILPVTWKVISSILGKMLQAPHVCRHIWTGTSSEVPPGRAGRIPLVNFSSTIPTAIFLLSLYRRCVVAHSRIDLVLFAQGCPRKSALLRLSSMLFHHTKESNMDISI